MQSRSSLRPKYFAGSALTIFAGMTTSDTIRPNQALQDRPGPHSFFARLLAVAGGPAGERSRYVTRVMTKYAENESRPAEDVLGLVDWKGGDEDDDGEQFTLAFTFRCWKILPGPMKTTPLSITITTSRQQYDSLWERVQSNTVVRIRARVVEDSAIGTPQAELLDFLGPDNSDSELNQAAVELEKPVIHQDSQFGQLTLDRRVNWYTAEAEWNGTIVALNLSLDDSGTIDAALQTARALWKRQREWTKRIEDYAVQELLPLKNESWLDENEAELTADQFKARMALESVTVASDGSFDFWHNDGGLFWGHSIQIGGNLSEGPTLADIPG
jgi:hypothetical protein